MDFNYVFMPIIILLAGVFIVGLSGQRILALTVPMANRYTSLLVASFLSALPLTAQKDTSTHNSQLVTVEQGVHLEVLDWGGSGSPLVFLGGSDAHVFDDF